MIPADQLVTKLLESHPMDAPTFEPPLNEQSRALLLGGKWKCDGRSDSWRDDGVLCCNGFFTLEDGTSQRIMFNWVGPGGVGAFDYCDSEKARIKVQKMIEDVIASEDEFEQDAG